MRPSLRKRAPCRYAIGVSLLVFLWLLAFSTATLAQAAGTGVLQGQVANKTPNGKSVADVPLELKTMVGGSEKSSTPGKTDANGKFQFTGLSTASNYSYQVTFNYQDADYTSDVVSFGSGETSKTIEVKVWDATSSDEAIKAESAHVIVQFEGKSLKVTEYYRFINQGDKTYVGSRVVPSIGQKETLRFSLPKGAKMQQLALGLMECCVAYEDGAFLDTMALMPGVREIAFIYSVKYSAPNFDLATRASYPTDKFNMVVEDRGIQVSSPQMPQAQSMTIEQTPFLLLSKENVKKGETLQATLSGLPRPSPLESLRWIGILFIVAAVAFGVVFPLTRKRKLAPARVPTGEDRRQILQEVARLDDAFEAGQVEAEEYRRLRSQKMARLMKLSQGRKRA